MNVFIYKINTTTIRHKLIVGVSKVGFPTKDAAAVSSASSVESVINNSPFNILLGKKGGSYTKYTKHMQEYEARMYNCVCR